MTKDILQLSNSLSGSYLEETEFGSSPQDIGRQSKRHDDEGKLEGTEVGHKRALDFVGPVRSLSLSRAQPFFSWAKPPQP